MSAYAVDNSARRGTKTPFIGTLKWDKQRMVIKSSSKRSGKARMLNFGSEFKA